MHEIVDIVALVVAALGLIPLWWDHKRRFIAVALTCCIVIGSGYVIWGMVQHHSQLHATKTAIVRAICSEPKTGLNFDSIYQQHLDYGLDWGTIDEAFGDLVDERTLEISTVSVTWDEVSKGRMPLRIWRVRSIDACKE